MQTVAEKAESTNRGHTAKSGHHDRYARLAPIMAQAFADAQQLAEQEGEAKENGHQTGVVYRHLTDAVYNRYGVSPAELAGFTNQEAMYRLSDTIFRYLAKANPVIVNGIDFPRYVNAGPHGLDDLDSIIALSVAGNAEARIKLEYVLGQYQRRMHYQRIRRNAIRHVLQALEKGQRVYRDDSTGGWRVSRDSVHGAGTHADAASPQAAATAPAQRTPRATAQRTQPAKPETEIRKPE